MKELTRKEKFRAQEGLMLFTQKGSRAIKGRLAYNGRLTRVWIDKEDKSSPTVLTESLFLTCAIDAYEGRDVMSLKIPNAFIQTGMPQKERGKIIIMKVRGKLVDWLVDLDSITYLNMVVIKKRVKVIYLEILRAIYGMSEASLLWYRKFQSDLETIGFEFNVYDPCGAQRSKDKHQHTIRFHVDDVLSSHVDPKENDGFAEWCQEKYGEMKSVEIKRGKLHTFLGMDLDFGISGECHVMQEHHIRDMVDVWPESKKTPQPGAINLFNRGESELLCENDREMFHSVIAKGLFIGNR